MPQSLSKILLHIVFSTKKRQPLIRPEIQDELFGCMAAICNDHHCHAHKIGGVTDHVHIACNLARTIAVSDLLEEVKKSFSKWIKTQGSAYQKFFSQNLSHHKFILKPNISRRTTEQNIKLARLNNPLF